METKRAETASWYAMVHVVELGVPAPEKLLALSKWHEVLGCT
jgi:hypothetical protein